MFTTYGKLGFNCNSIELIHYCQNIDDQLIIKNKK